MDHYYYMGTGEHHFSQFIGAEKSVSVDVETAADRIIGVSMSDNGLDGYYLPEIDDRVRSRLEDHTLKIAHNARYDYGALLRKGIEMPFLACTMILAHLLEEKELSLKALSQRFLGMRVRAFEDVVPVGMDLSMIPEREAARYSCPHAISTYVLYNTLVPEAIKLGVMGLFWGTEMPFIPVLHEMERTGIQIDKDELARLEIDLENRKRNMSDAMTYLVKGLGVPMPVNFGSPDQVRHILFDRLGLPVQKLTGKNKVPSTDADSLAPLAGYHQLVPVLIQYREVDKLLSSFIRGPKGIGMNVQPDGRVYSTFSQVGTGTGRLSSRNPNDQNIPKRKPLGRRMRKAFIARDGCVLLSGDYDQAELRMLAHFSQDPKLIQVYRNNGDVHKETAIEVFNDPERRRDGKEMNFITVFGGGIDKLAERMKITKQEAKMWRDKYLEKYGGILKFISGVARDVKATGRVRTLRGRVRTVKEEDVKHGNEGPNTIIQGSTAEIVKEGMVRVFREVKRRGLQSKMILQVHDEVLMEVPMSEKDEVVSVLKEFMPENSLTVPIPVSVEVGKNWYQMVEV